MCPIARPLTGPRDGLAWRIRENASGGGSHINTSEENLMYTMRHGKGEESHHNYPVIFPPA